MCRHGISKWDRLKKDNQFFWFMLMAFFPISSSTIIKISKGGSFDDVAGFLVLSRHADSKALPGYAPHRFSGAGVNAVHEKICIGEEGARGVLSRLKMGGFIGLAPPDVLAMSRYAKWDLQPEKPDLFLPHRFVDPGQGWSSPIQRLRKTAFSESTNDLQTLSAANRKLDCLMLLLTLHRKMTMSRFGGLDPAMACRPWTVQTKDRGAGGTRWGATPDQEFFDSRFVHECLAHCPDLHTQSRNGFPRFLAAWRELRRLGLLYEAVTLFPGNSHKVSGDLLYTVRTNDFFASASASDSKGDPSLMASLEAAHGTLLAFYTQPGAGSDNEALRVVLPEDVGILVGIWRPRFRPDTPDVGRWFEAEHREVRTALHRISSAQAQGH